jgi:adenylate cyclase
LVAVIFTDLVRSTAMTQERGDAGAQEVVRTHNQIVRAALQRHNGVEVKHTGDGIMARFDSTVNAATGSLDIQSGLAAHNSAHPERPVNVRIGINSGTPIQGDDDLFGTTVQLAARICDKGQAGRVMTSNIVRELCAGQNVRFEEGGAFDLKGVEGPGTLYFAQPPS